MTSPVLKDPGKTAFNNLKTALHNLNVVAANGGNVDAASMALLNTAAAACENFKKKEADATNVVLKTATNQTYRHGAVHQLAKLRVEFDYDGKHYKISG
jgi:hypothetical protein